MTFKTRQFACAALCALLISSPAYAGFDWMPPAKGQKSMAPIIKAGPTPMVDVEELEPVAVVETGVAVMPVENGMAVEAVPVAVVEEDFIYEEISGFGSDIPLAMAMAQIVPSDYAYSFDQGIDPGMRVSWNGGKPWSDVLREAVAPMNLKVLIRDNTVWLREGAEIEEMVIVKAAEPILVAEPVEPVMEPKVVTPALDMYASDVPETQPRRQMPPQIMKATPMKPEVSREEALAAVDALNNYNLAPNAAPQELVTETAQTQTTMAADTQMANTTDRMAGDVPTYSPMMNPPGYEYHQNQTHSKTDTAAKAPVAITKAEPIMAKKSDAPKVMDPYEIRYWQATKGDRLKALLTKWTDDSNVQLVWNTGFDYRLPQEIAMHGTFPDVVSEVLTAFTNVDPRPIGQLHPNLPQGPSVLVINNHVIAPATQ